MRAERTRRRVVDALLTLNDEGHIRPTARDIADRAGVSVRSLYVHFQDLDALMLAAARRHRDRVEALAPPLVTDGPLAARLAALVTRRVAVLEVGAGVHRAARLAEPTSPAIQRSLAAGRRLVRGDVTAALAPELGARPAVEADGLTSAAEVVTSHATWEHLRVHRGLDVDGAAAMLLAMLATLVEGWPAGQPLPATTEAR